jgi:hypothetical protein
MLAGQTDMTKLIRTFLQIFVECSLKGLQKYSMVSFYDGSF